MTIWSFQHIFLPILAWWHVLLLPLWWWTMSKTPPNDRDRYWEFGLYGLPIMALVPFAWLLAGLAGVALVIETRSKRGG